MPWCLDTSQRGCPEVWEDSDDEKISCEKKHKGQIVNTGAQEILQCGDAVVSGVGGGTPDGIDWKKQINERGCLRRKEDKLPRVRDGGGRTPWTLERAVELCLMAYRCKNNALPYPADSTEQIAWWEKQFHNKIGPSGRTILMKTDECPPGTKELSPKIKYMTQYGKSAEVAAKRKREGFEAKSRAHTGQDQKNSVESVAIHLLLVFFRAAISGFDRDWEVMPVFDGLEADFMIRKKDWQPDVWVPLQMKSASECVKDKQARYLLTHGDYPNVFCVCVGLQGFVHRTADVKSPNDIANALGCSIGEIWNIGSCSDIEKSMAPTYGVPYSKFPADRRLHFPGTADEVNRIFAEALLRDIENWPIRLERNRIFYEVSDTINSNVADSQKIEKKGFEVVDAALRTHGLRVDPVWRQNECVDYAIVRVDSGEPLVFVSGKTGTMKHDDPKQRFFKLKCAPNKRFCDVVVASYSGAYHKVAVMGRDKAYVEGKKNFYWNEDRLDPGVRVFDDIRLPQVGKAFAEHLLTFAR
jgi:hypothetical protein